MTPKEIRRYQMLNGKLPFQEWLLSLDFTIQARILKRIYYLEQGNLGDYRSVGLGVFELRFHFGPGYRIYFGQDGKVLIVLLGGGDKNSQNSDILLAQRFWLDYIERSKE